MAFRDSIRYESMAYGMRSKPKTKMMDHRFMSFFFYISLFVLAKGASFVY